MSRTLLTWLLAMSVSLNLGIGAAVVFDRMSAMPEASPPRLPAPHPGCPIISTWILPNANAGGREAERQFLEDVADNWREIRAQRETLVRQIFAETPERAAIDAVQARIALLQDRQQRRAIAQFPVERDLLERHQRIALMNLLLDRYAQESTEEEQLHRD